MTKGVDNKRIAKNTMILYLRMIFLMLISLYTSRVVLATLGVDDYGIYNVVGGFVSMFSILRSGLVSATQRFITFDLGRGNIEALRETYSSSMHIYIMISLVVLVLAETIGIWFIENKMVIPADRLYAAHWVFQLSLVTLIVGLISNPQHSLIIAHERMSTFAYISLYEAVAKLVIVYMLALGNIDKLIFYSILTCLVQVSLRLIYGIYCKRNFEEAKMLWTINWGKIKDIYGFTGWSMFGGLSVIGRTQGLNMLLNLFFGPAVNAARGVAVHVLSAVNGFVTNFQTALNPQIVKTYARNELESMHKLVFRSSKLSFVLLFLLSLPLSLEAVFVLDLWLKDVPDNTVDFVRLLFVVSIIDAISNPLVRSIEATGKVRKYQLVAGTMMLMVLPLSYVFLRCGGEPSLVYWTTIVVNSLVLFFRLKLTGELIQLNVGKFVKDVVFRCLLMSVIAFSISYYVHALLPMCFVRLMVVVVVAFLSTMIFSYYLVLDEGDRSAVHLLIKKKFKHGRN